MLTACMSFPGRINTSEMQRACAQVIRDDFSVVEWTGGTLLLCVVIYCGFIQLDLYRYIVAAALVIISFS